MNIIGENYDIKYKKGIKIFPKIISNHLKNSSIKRDK